ncbi:MAG: hypothetical protein PHC28_09395 [Flavobacterium sp.]|uniref:hypothetical protein n=1 Tax=Flavobacterium sp. TaxID=239 RepID=UPI0026397803|nr:hypothetical protein [Flavobacterium sp.]MDD5150684.1 hypothetical protein [Flavobacterium sp.]
MSWRNDTNCKCGHSFLQEILDNPNIGDFYNPTLLVCPNCDSKYEVSWTEYWDDGSVEQVYSFDEINYVT